MRNKILIVEKNPEDQTALEKILHSLVEDGAELFFAKKKQAALAIMDREHPQLVFVDESLIGKDIEQWNIKGVRVVVMQHKTESSQQREDFILKPFQQKEILEKCHSTLMKSPRPSVPPM